MSPQAVLEERSCGLWQGSRMFRCLAGSGDAVAPVPMIAVAAGERTLQSAGLSPRIQWLILQLP